MGFRAMKGVAGRRLYGQGRGAGQGLFGGRAEKMDRGLYDKARVQGRDLAGWLLFSRDR